MPNQGNAHNIMMLHDILLHAGRTSARRTAIQDADDRRSYGEVDDRVRRAAAGLADMGLTPGDHVAIVSPNTAFYLEAYFACSLAGLVVVPVNTRLSPAEVAFILEDSKAKAILVDDACANLISGANADRRVRLTDAGDGSWEALIRDNDPLAAPAGPQDENATAHIFYTGGTTGRAKGVMLSHRNVAASSNNKIMLGQFARDDVWLHAAPMFHQADSWACFSFTAVGAAHVFMPSFAPGNALDLIETHRVTASQFVPTMVLMMLETEGVATRDLSSVRRILYGSAPMPTETLKRCQSVFGDVFQHIYGLTEAAGTVATTPWPPEPGETGGARMASCGQPIAGVDMRIADEDGTETTTGTIGRIQVKGATIMSGYWGREAETAAAFVDGWLDTGDLGHMDEDGFVFIVDRAKDMIITGGENVYSTEVENVLHGHAAVADAAVIGLPDPKWGEAVTAIVVAEKDTDLREADLLAYCRDRLAGYKCPKSILICDALPKSAAGKVLKHELRAAYAENQSEPA